MGRSLGQSSWRGKMCLSRRFKHLACLSPGTRLFLATGQILRISRHSADLLPRSDASHSAYHPRVSPSDFELRWVYRPVAYQGTDSFARTTGFFKSASLPM